MDTPPCHIPCHDNVDGCNSIAIQCFLAGRCHGEFAQRAEMSISNQIFCSFGLQLRDGYAFRRLAEAPAM